MITKLKGNPHVTQLMFRIKSMGLCQGKDAKYMELTLDMETVKQFEGRLTLREDDATKMFLKINNGIIVDIRSSDYVV